MRLVTYRSSTGESRAGLVVGAGGAVDIVDVATASGGRLPNDVIGVLAAGDPGMAVLAELEPRTADHDGGSVIALDDVELLAPIARPGKLIAAAGNYQAHVVEGGLPPVDKSRTVPKLFLKPSTCIIGPGATLTLPTVSSSVDWELELAVVIGRGGRDITEAGALDHVAGFTVINDVSARRMDWGIDERAAGPSEGFFDWLEGKWLDGFAPMGPWIVTRDEIADPDDLELRLDVNGELRQQARTSGMIFGTAELVSFASRLMTLEPGDVIATGTPAGVGETTRQYLGGGDVMSGWIEGIGSLVTPVAAPGAAK